MVTQPLINTNCQDNFLQAGGELQELTIRIIYLPVVNATVSLLLLFELPDRTLSALISSPDIKEAWIRFMLTLRTTLLLPSQLLPNIFTKQPTVII